MYAYLQESAHVYNQIFSACYRGDQDNIAATDLGEHLLFGQLPNSCVGSQSTRITVL